MKIIKLKGKRGDGKVVIVDNTDFEYLNKNKWYLGSQRHAIRTEKGKTIYMHKLIMNVERGFYVDHADGNPLNNQRFNLRKATNSQNQMNRKNSSINTSGYKGVTWNKKLNKWRAQIYLEKKYIYLGYFKNIKDAASAYNEKARNIFGQFSRLNHIEEYNEL
mgnify:CR=1 FL=1